MTPSSGSTSVSVAHLSDPHLAAGAAAPAAGLSRALAQVLTLNPPPTCVVISGDLADLGAPEEYDLLREIVDGFPLPLFLATGNHDDRENLVAAFGGGEHLGGGESAHYLVEYPELTLVVLDSLVPGAPGGLLGSEQLDWLDTVLDRRPEVPALVCVHHPPVPLGLPFQDGMRLDDGAELEAVVAHHPNVARVLAGHVHRQTATGFGGSVLSTAPSTYLQSPLQRDSDGPPGFAPEPTAFLLHQQTDHGWVTHTVQVNHVVNP
ncbi:phosphodiesterase [Nocardiopsis eucommiae]|uniref:phosphodiesterase n=1 Tax=Nocardiopsis eucommiae TaxID=2831970 RepID=UPI003D745F51